MRDGAGRKDDAMMTVVTRVRLQQGKEPEWDAAMRERLAAARGRPGWVSGQLLIPLEALDERVIVGSWDTRADWEAWHEEETFLATRERLEGLQAASSETTWHEVILDVRQEG
jgi:heme-degrading monooxygenase HmoA